MLEFIPSKQVPQRLTEGWQIVSRNRGDYAALMHAPDGWEPIVGGGETISLLYRVHGTLKRLDGKKPFKRQGIRIVACRHPGCEEVHQAKGFCRKHYQRLRANGSPSIVCKPGPAEAGKCAERGCRKKSRARGLCNMHWKRVRKAELERAT